MTSIIKSNRQWQGFQSVTGTTVIDISDVDFEELFIKVTITGNNKACMSIPKTAIGTEEFYRSGGWQSNSNSELVIVKVTRTSVVLNLAYLNGTNYTSTATTSVYYK